MHPEKVLIRVLRGIADLVAEEASTNPAFARRLGQLLEGIPSTPNAAKKRHAQIPKEELPDLFSEANARSAEDFEAWLSQLAIPMLKALVRKHDLDSSRRTHKWREPEKFAKLIAAQFLSRMQRGSAFLSPPPEEISP